jgi:putative peptide zinc metalloprotease protein
MNRHRRLFATTFAALLLALGGARATAQTEQPSPVPESAQPTAEATSVPESPTDPPTATDAGTAATPAASAASSPGPAVEGPDNAAIAVNTKDGTDLFRLAFSVDKVMSTAHDDPDNAAVAYSSCNACETTAIAVQVVISSTPPEGESSPTNLAIAINENCTSCETVALAYQLAIYSEEPVKLSKEGRDQVKDIVDRMRALEDQDLPPDQLNAQMDSLVGELGQVYTNELEPKHQDVGKQSETEQGDTDPSDSLPDPGMTTTPDDDIDLGDDTTPAPRTSEPAATTVPAPDPTSSPSATSEPSAAPEASP